MIPLQVVRPSLCQIKQLKNKKKRVRFAKYSFSQTPSQKDATFGIVLINTRSVGRIREGKLLSFPATVPLVEMLPSLRQRMWGLSLKLANLDQRIKIKGFGRKLMTPPAVSLTNGSVTLDFFIGDSCEDS